MPCMNSSLQWRKENPEQWKEIKKRSYLKHRDKNREIFREYYQRNKQKMLDKAAVYRDANREKVRRAARIYYRKSIDPTKKQVFSHYGKNGEMQCSWKGCEVRDMDMLSIDHIDGNGSKHREKVGRGLMFYRWLVRNKYPEGFQTLCMNHQAKKEILRRKANRIC
jgi:hypothetical protein